MINKLLCLFICLLGSGCDNSNSSYKDIFCNTHSARVVSKEEYSVMSAKSRRDMYDYNEEGKKLCGW